jgi:hypothetical protein
MYALLINTKQWSISRTTTLFLPGGDIWRRKSKNPNSFPTFGVIGHVGFEHKEQITICLSNGDASLITWQHQVEHIRFCLDSQFFLGAGGHICVLHYKKTGISLSTVDMNFAMWSHPALTNQPKTENDSEW